MCLRFDSPRSDGLNEICSNNTCDWMNCSNTNVFVLLVESLNQKWLFSLLVVVYDLPVVVKATEPESIEEPSDTYRKLNDVPDEILLPLG